MTDQTPEPVDSGGYEIDESAVEPEHTTNVVDAHDDVWLDDNQSDLASPGLYEADDDEADETIPEDLW